MPGKFLFGASTSSHQVEGGNENDWTEWEKKNADHLAAASGHRYPPENYISGRACDSYNRFEEDFDIAKALGHNAHRFSLEWSRIEPEEGRFDEKEIAHYGRVIRALRARGLEPFVTLWHWALPLWLSRQNGVENLLFPLYFKRYAKKIVESLGPDIHFWVIVNEPEVFTGNAYLNGLWPPQKKNWLSWYTVIKHLVYSHRAVYKIIKERFPDAEVGAVMNLVYFESGGGIVNNALARSAHFLRDRYFLNHVRASLDFIGLNYYFHNRVYYGFGKNLNKEVTDMGWEIYPEGIYKILMDLKRYHLPIYVTENGLADAKDEKRTLFITEHLAYIRRAMEEGVDVRGYLHWSLLDNFEWDKGFWPRFGLVAVDYKTEKRTVRPSAYAYKKIIEGWENMHGK
jgi:beta-glucosidase